MPITQDFTLPSSAESLQISPGSAFFIAFLASKDPNTKKPWCPDVVAALPTLEATFKGEKKPAAAFVEVGQRPEWKEAKNVFRTKWNVHNVPTLVRYEKLGSDAKEVGRLIEGEILDESRLQELISGSSKN
ncbi:putative Thioredoxin domain-containing protein [Septoria linicola]|nr:putative Thioredoxin domain-containing protein [Septoria linicola]